MHCEIPIKRLTVHGVFAGSKTVGISVVSHGVTGLGVNFTASNAKIVKAENGTGYDLQFNFDADAVGLVVSWNVQVRRSRP